MLIYYLNPSADDLYMMHKPNVCYKDGKHDVPNLGQIFTILCKNLKKQTISIDSIESAKR